MTDRKKTKRPKMGRPPKPADQVRRNRVVVTLTDAELAKLEQLADEQGLPTGTVTYGIVSRALARRK